MSGKLLMELKPFCLCETSSVITKSNAGGLIANK